MPIRNEAGDVTLFLTGEVFDRLQCREALKKGGHRFPDHGASYLVHLYETMGEQFFENRNGLYSGILLDHRQKKAFLFNDRYGMKRLFIHERENELYFASGARALLAALPETRDFDPVGLGEYFTCGCPIGNRSIYQNIGVLPSASCWTLENGEVSNKRIYFDRSDWERQERLDGDRFAERVMETLPGVVEQYAKAGLPRGISLTGGLDSRILVACLDMTPGEFPCYTFGSMYRDTYDVRQAREIANACGQSHTVLVPGRDFLKNFPQYLEGAVLRSDGYLGLSGAAELYVNSLAREIAPIRLTGNYGSELFRGVRAFKSRMPRGGMLTADFWLYLTEAEHTFEALENTDPLSFTLFHQAPHQGYGRLAIEESQVIMRTPFLDNELVRVIYQRPAAFSDGADLSASVIHRYRPDLAQIPTDRGDLGKGILLEKWFRRMYHEALFKGEYWASHGMPQWVAMLTHCAPILSPEGLMLGRHKFQHYTRWLRMELSEYVRDVMLSNAHLPHFFEKRNLEVMVYDHLRGRRNYMDEIDKILTIILSTKLFFNQTEAAETRNHQKT
jgi:asparagine synthase (glutamine-hydrolysing)